MSSGSFLSSDWYRVAALRPRLRSHVEIHRQRFRGDIWYIIQDHNSGRYHRVTPAANLILSLMNGRRSMHELWELACERFGEEPPTQSETIQLLSQLHNADLISANLPPDMSEIGRRHARQERQSMLSRIKNPLAMRFPLLDPDSFLEATLPLVRPIFTVAGFLIWLALVLTGIVLLALNWETLSENVVDRVLAANNIILIILAFPVIKTFHELGHAYATKVWGGEVHEIGIMMLIFIPVPFVDASASSAFDSKWRRVVVGGAGIMVELAMASAALIFWLNAEQGLATAFAYNIMLIGGVSTLLFNGNPLLRFDGYFVFADLIEIPNLGTRSNKYFWYLIQRYILRIRDPENPVMAKGERPWLLFYSIAAFIYRIFISFAIALFIASKFFVIGILLAMWALFNTFIKPLLKGIKFLLVSPKLRGKRRRVLSLTSLAAAAVAALIFALPVPYATTAYAVIWLSPDAIVRAETEGFVREVHEGPVEAGNTILRLENPVLAARVDLNEARLEEVQIQLNAALLFDRVQAEVLQEQVHLLEGQLLDTRNRQVDLDVAASKTARFVVPGAEDLPGRHLLQGDVVGYLLDDSQMRLRAAVSQSDADLVRNRTNTVEILFERDLLTPVPARVVSETPESQTLLPSIGLSAAAGGDFVLDPSQGDEPVTFEGVFLFDIEPIEHRELDYIGERAMVRFSHGDEPFGFRVYRAVRQLFLKQFNV